MGDVEENLARLEKRDKRRSKSSDPLDYLAIGLFVGLVGGAVLGFGVAADQVLAVALGAVVASVGSLFLLIGVVAQGVLVALRRHSADEA